MNETLVDDQDLKEAKQEIEDWPFEFIEWGMHNSERLDIVATTVSRLNKKGKTPPNEDKCFTNDILRRDERGTSFNWNSN
jgi:hypothetical protein